MQQIDLPSASRRAPDSSARRAGILLFLTALATFVAVAGRVAADADQPTTVGSLAAISESRVLYGVGGAGRLIPGVMLIAGAWFLWKTWIIRERLGTPLVPGLFAASGLFTSVSGAFAIALALSAPESDALNPAELGSTIETTAALRWITGKIGFAAAGLALVVAARYQWKVGGTLRRISPVSAIVGVAMQFTWVDSATMLHQVTGTVFFLWLIVIGVMLMTGRVERHFTTMLGSSRRVRSQSNG